MSDREILTTREVSAEYPFAEGTLKYWRGANQGPASFVVGKRILYRRSEIERFIAEKEKETTRGGAA